MSAGIAQLPADVIEQILGRLTFEQRGRAATVCRAWQQHLSKPGPLWAAAVLPDRYDGVSVQQFVSLQRWMRRHGSQLRQFEAKFPMTSQGDSDGNSLTTALLGMLGTNDMRLEALRLESFCPVDNTSLACIAGLGGSLRHLALLGMHCVQHTTVVAMLQSLPLLEDLTLQFGTYAEEYMEENELEHDPPDVLRLLRAAARHCSRLQSLALIGDDHATEETAPQPGKLPHQVTRLAALTSLALHHASLTAVPDSFSALLQLQRLSLSCTSDVGNGRPLLQKQLSALTNLATLQVSGLPWPARLPASLTKLSLEQPAAPKEPPQRPKLGTLRPLTALQHLALHQAPTLQHWLPALCGALAQLPRLRSLHLVRCGLTSLPPELCALSQLQMLDMCCSPALLDDGGAALAAADLGSLSRCVCLDLRSDEDRTQLSRGAIAQLATMPALKQLALPTLACAGAENVFSEEVAQLSRRRAAGAPPIDIVAVLERSSDWSTVEVDIAFPEASPTLGVQLKRHVARLPPGFWVSPFVGRTWHDTSSCIPHGDIGGGQVQNDEAGHGNGGGGATNGSDADTASFTSSQALEMWHADLEYMMAMHPAHLAQQSSGSDE